MKISKSLTIAVILICFGIFAANSMVQLTELRLRFELGIGFWHQGSEVQTNVGLLGVETKVNSEGLLFSIGYSYWLREKFALVGSLYINPIGVESSVGAWGVNNYTAFVNSILVGGRIYPLVSHPKSSTRLYFGLAMGLCTDSETGQEIGFSGISVEDHSSTVFGSNINIGLDIQLSRLFMLGLNGGFNFMADFSEPIGGRKNYSSGYAGMSISLLFGGK
jgi:hypothetical protein